MRIRATTYRIGCGSIGEGAIIKYRTRTTKIPSIICMIIMETGLEETDRYNDNGCDKSLTELPRSGIAQVTSSQLQFMILVLQVYNSSDISY